MDVLKSICPKYHLDQVEQGGLFYYFFQLQLLWFLVRIVFGTWQKYWEANFFGKII